MSDSSSQTIEVVEDKGKFQIHRQVEYKNGMMFMRSKRRKIEPEF